MVSLKIAEKGGCIAIGDRTVDDVEEKLEQICACGVDSQRHSSQPWEMMSL